MGNRRFLSWPLGWRKSLPLGLIVGLAVGAAFIVAEGRASGGKFIDWCGTSIIVLIVAVGVTTVFARSHSRKDENHEQGSREPVE